MIVRTIVRDFKPLERAAIFTSMPALALSEVIAWWILTCTLERFQGLKIVFVEPSLYWIPGFLASLDHKADHGYHLPGLRLKPSEFPHPATTWPHSQEIVARQFAHIPAEERDLICSANAARVYGFS
jgi:hypothetical protein